MKNLILSTPSKTFLCGEYAVLNKGPALILNTEPRFQLSLIESALSPLALNISEQSPAGKLFKKYLDKFIGKRVNFTDPHHGKGGFGASSAQFIFLANYLGFSNPWKILNLYREYAWNGIGIMPSGADVIAQITGKLTFFHEAENKIEKLGWPFPDLTIVLLHTGNKIATHEHLNTLSSASFPQLQEIALSVYNAIKCKNESIVIKCINDYAQEMYKLGYVALHTKDLIAKILLQPGVKAVKGCGALGADVILILLSSDKVIDFQAWISKENIRLIYMGTQLSDGLI